MKLSLATEQDKFRALAELDGGEDLNDGTFLFHYSKELETRLTRLFGHQPKRPGLFVPRNYWYHTTDENDKGEYICTTYCDYLISYDAIIPLVKKWAGEDKNRNQKFITYLANSFYGSDKPENTWYGLAMLAWNLGTPIQLADALLIASGKFE